MTGPFDPRPDPLPADIQAERQRRQRGRAIVMAVLLGGLVVLIFAITVAKIKLGMVR